MCVCVSTHVHTCVYVFCVQVHGGHICGGQNITSIVIPQETSILISKTGSLTGLKLIKQTRLVRQRAPRDPLVSASPALEL